MSELSEAMLNIEQQEARSALAWKLLVSGQFPWVVRCEFEVPGRGQTVVLPGYVIWAYHAHQAVTIVNAMHHDDKSLVGFYVDYAFDDCDPTTFIAAKQGRFNARLEVRNLVEFYCYRAAGMHTSSVIDMECCLHQNGNVNGKGVHYDYRVSPSNALAQFQAMYCQDGGGVDE